MKKKFFKSISLFWALILLIMAFLGGASKTTVVFAEEKGLAKTLLHKDFPKEILMSF
jgi:hypothetical protein